MLIDRACAYGDGLFETIAIRDGDARLWSAHLARIQTGCMRLGLESPSSELLLELLNIELNASNIGTNFASARMVVSAAASARGYRRNPEGDCVTDITLYPAKPLAKSFAEKGIATRMCSSRLAIQPTMAGIKTLNRLEQVIARSEWNDDEVFEGLMRDTDGRLICGTMSNVF